MKKMSTKKIVTIAMLTALSYILAVMVRFPLLLQATFIKYTPSDIPIVIGGMLFGPLEAFIMSLSVSIIEGITVGTSGFIGIIMNVFSTAAFAVVISAIYGKKKTTKNAIVGFCIGSIAMIVIMVLLNILLTPIYTGAPREKVMAMLLSAIIPVNLVKAIINSTLSFTIFKGVFKYIKVKKYDQD